MPETTQRNRLEALRYQSNVEQGSVNRADEEQLQRIADFIMATVPTIQSEMLKDGLADMANRIVQSKGQLARAGSAEQQASEMAVGPQSVPPSPPVAPEGIPPEALAAAGAV
jgi:hypothetical protein